MRRVLVGLIVALGLAASATADGNVFCSATPAGCQVAGATGGGITGLSSDGSAITSTLPILIRNGTNPQTFYIYNTYTDANNYERSFLRYSGTTIVLGSEGAGTGSNYRDVQLGTLLNRVVFGPSGSGFSADGAGTTFTPHQSDYSSLGEISSNRSWRHLYLARAVLGSKSKDITESTATTFVTVAVPQTAGANFAGGKVIYTVYATDGTDTQVITGELTFSAVNKAGTVTASLTDAQGSPAASAGTLTAALTAVGSGDSVLLKCNAASSLTQTALKIQYRLDMPQINTVTPE